MRAEAVILESAAPVVVGDVGSLLLRAYSIHPVVVVGEASSGPAQHWNLESLQGVEDILAVAVDIGHVGILAHPQPAVDATAEMFRELSVDFRRNGHARTGVMHPDSRVLGVEGLYPEQGQTREKN